MKRFEFTIDTTDEFEIDGETIDNIKRYLQWRFNTAHVNVNSWDLPDWISSYCQEQHYSIAPEIPF